MWQHFFDNEKKYMNKYIYKMNDYPQYILYKKDEIESKKGNWGRFFKNSNPINIEIGSGSGNFTTTIAEQNREKNYIGFELRFKRLISSAKKSKHNELQNILFLRKRGEEINKTFAESEINDVYINFPEPWDKKIKNRVVSQKLLNDLNLLMGANGVIKLKTDHLEYYQYVIDLVEKNPYFSIRFKTEYISKTEKVEENILTEFEQLFKSKGITTKYLEIQKEV